MNDDTTTKPDRDARIYQKPRLRIVELVAEEVLAVGCKMIGVGAGPVGGGLGCSAPTACFSGGS